MLKIRSLSVAVVVLSLFTVEISFAQFGGTISQMMCPYPGSYYDASTNQCRWLAELDEVTVNGYRDPEAYYIDINTYLALLGAWQNENDQRHWEDLERQWDEANRQIREYQIQQYQRSKEAEEAARKEREQKQAQLNQLNQLAKEAKNAPYCDANIVGP